MRSIWRETKLLLLLMATGFADIDEVTEDFRSVATRLSVEKRKKLRPLQMIAFP
jgi:hypothetical protein